MGKNDGLLFPVFDVSVMQPLLPQIAFSVSCFTLYKVEDVLFVTTTVIGIYLAHILLEY